MKNINKLSAIAREKLIREFKGKSNAKHRSFLLQYLRMFDPSITDREVRRLYNEILPIGWCERGIYVIDDLQEIDKMIEIRRKVIRSHEKYIENLIAYRKFLLDTKGGHQMRLF